MKRAFAFVVIFLLTVILSGCEHSPKPANDIFNLPDELPVLIEVFPDDPTIDSWTISDNNRISTIISMLSDRMYKEVKLVTPLGNTSIKLVYDNGTERMIGLHGVVDSFGKKYEPISRDELVSLLYSYSEN